MSEFCVNCPRCGIALSRLGMRDLHYGGIFRSDLGRVNKMAVDMFVCTECGHLELFHTNVGRLKRAQNPPFERGEGAD